jgi:hypothetical protein
MVNNSTGIVDHHSMSWSERWFFFILVELLTITQWVEVRGDFYWYWWNCWPSLNESLTSTHWVMVNNSTNININHISPKFIEWWSTIPPISTTIISHFNSLSDGQQFHQYQITSHLIVDHHSMSWSERWFLLILVELLTITQWVKVRGDFCWYWWNCWPSLNELRWEVIFVWLSTIPLISTTITSHHNSLSDGQQFHQYQQKSPLT